MSGKCKECMDLIMKIDSKTNKDFLCCGFTGKVINTTTWIPPIGVCPKDFLNNYYSLKNMENCNLHSDNKESNLKQECESLLNEINENIKDIGNNPMDFVDINLVKLYSLKQVLERLLEHGDWEVEE